MKKELESIIMEQLKKGYCPVYAREEGYIVITMKAYLAAAEYAGAEDLRFWYDDLCYDMIDVETREDEIEGGHFTFMPREDYKFKVGDIICPTTEADRHYGYTGTNMISAEVTEIKGRNMMEIRVKQHKDKTLIGEVFHVNPSYFELATNIKLISADGIFSDLEDIDLVYRAIDEKISNLGGAIYYLKSWREDLNEIRLNEKLDDLSKELNRYEAIFDRIVEYEKVRKQMEVKRNDD